MERVYTTPLLDKLGIRPGMRVAIVGTFGAGEDDDVRTFRSMLGDRTSDVTRDAPAPETDIVLLVADTAADLDRELARLRRLIKPNGSIWVLSRKGKAATIRDVEVIALAREHELIDNKVVSFSATRTGLRLVIPVALRPRT